MTTVLPSIALTSLQRGEHELAGAEVEVAGRLVAEDERRVLRQRASDRDALLLAAGELVREVLHALAEARPSRAAPSASSAGSAAVARGELERELDVLLRASASG